MVSFVEKGNDGINEGYQGNGWAYDLPKGGYNINSISTQDCFVIGDECIRRYFNKPSLYTCDRVVSKPDEL